MNQQQRAVVQQALEALEKMQNAICNIGGEHVTDLDFAIEQAEVAEFTITALRQLLEAQPEPVQEPFGTYMGHRMTPSGTKEFWVFADALIPEGTKLYTTPPTQPAAWAGLTDDAKHELARKFFTGTWARRVAIGMLDAHEAKLREKNGGAA